VAAGGRKPGGLRGFVAAIVALAAIAGCGIKLSPPPRPIRALPSFIATDDGYVTKLLNIPAGYSSAGREFYLHARRLSGPPEPLVLVLHGLDQSPRRVEAATGAISFSETHGFTLVYPIGVKEAWNAGNCCRHDTANDLGYLVDLVRYVYTLTPIDLHRVYIWGFSNGGMMAWRAVCQTRNVFAGAGVVAGALLVPCRVPVHVVDLHGTHDRTVPYAGGYSTFTRTVFPDSRKERGKLAPGSTLKVVSIKGLGHAWPPLRPGELDALNVLWQALRGYRVAQPTAVPAASEG
jgi:predicted esterase